MLLALAATALVVAALLAEELAPLVAQAWRRHKARVRVVPAPPYDPGRERRAEQRARELLRSCVGEEDWAMYRELGFIRVWGKLANGPGGTGGAPYGFLIYPHKPVVSYLAQTHRLLNEYCVTFPDLERPYGSELLPDSDDVLAKWMALTGDERRLLEQANMHLPGRQLAAEKVRRDLWRLHQWERVRLRQRHDRAPARPGG
ncbi:MAG: hypothetical protein JO321_04190 [Solirubrobacterales bacterium]|nr:hypothetical protein [Solirubrobacterales bacterium]MBV8940623.1 hypothetical protein [Solirubrobacterales bacterium]MBV9168059.1 hypothetical protein [Solirubrobacterales bacterium]MBV9534596.1 hypothetical protein [Solirubrobacterales bacterium]